MIKYFKKTADTLIKSLNSIKEDQFERLLDDCEKTIKQGHKIIATGLGKNVPICEKFEGAMLSLGLNCHFMHSNTAMHGDLGMVHDGDLIIVLTKSASTVESVILYDQLKKRDCTIWLLTFNNNGVLAKEIHKKIVISLEHEGDQWNLMPNNSSTINLIVLQELAMQLAIRLKIQLPDFKKNHPGGAIGEALKSV